MSIEDQKFMSLCGLRMWAMAVITAAGRLDAAKAVMLASFDDNEAEHSLVFNAERHLFIVSANKLIEHIDWAKNLNFLDHTVFPQIEAMGSNIKTMRDLNEHVLEYFKGPGRRPHEWIHSDAESSTDASSTIGTRLGGRLDYKELAKCAQELREKLPKFYLPPSGPHETSKFVWSWEPFKTSS